MNEQQKLYDVIAILTKKLGGRVEITDEELHNPPKGVVTSDKIGGKIILEVQND